MTSLRKWPPRWKLSAGTAVEREAGELFAAHGVPREIPALVRERHLAVLRHAARSSASVSKRMFRLARIVALVCLGPLTVAAAVRGEVPAAIARWLKALPSYVPGRARARPAAAASEAGVPAGQTAGASRGLAAPDEDVTLGVPHESAAPGADVSAGVRREPAGRGAGVGAGVPPEPAARRTEGSAGVQREPAARGTDVGAGALPGSAAPGAELTAFAPSVSPARGLDAAAGPSVQPTAVAGSGAATFDKRSSAVAASPERPGPRVLSSRRESTPVPTAPPLVSVDPVLNAEPTAPPDTSVSSTSEDPAASPTEDELAPGPLSSTERKAALAQLRDAENEDPDIIPSGRQCRKEMQHLNALVADPTLDAKSAEVALFRRGLCRLVLGYRRGSEVDFDEYLRRHPSGRFVSGIQHLREH